MANSKRRYINKNGKMFIPMNVEGGTWNENFITTPKLIAIGSIIFSAVLIWLLLSSGGYSRFAYLLYFSIWFIVSIYVLRFIVFEEKFYYRMYKQLKESEITTPSIFWDVASIKDTEDGGILTYSDAKVAILVKIERDTITGKNKEFKEQHYDAISEFYRELVNYKYSFVQMNIMEQAGNDPRLQELDKILVKSDNPNITKLVEKQIGHIKNITHKTLYESDYILIYTEDIQRIDFIISDAVECIYKILDGGYIGYKILNSKEIIEFVKEAYGVKYFNSTDATLNIFKNKLSNMVKPFEISALNFSTGETQKVGKKEINKISILTSEVLKGNKDINDVALKDTILSKENKIDGVNFGSLVGDFDSIEKRGEEKEEEFKGKENGGSITKKIRLPKRKKDNTEVDNFQQEENNQFDGFNDSVFDDEYIDF